jgi:predicted RNA-binding protein (virulence factor B family)
MNDELIEYAKDLILEHARAAARQRVWIEASEKLGRYLTADEGEAVVGAIVQSTITVEIPGGAS